MADGPRDLRLEQLRVAPKVAHQRVAEDHDPVVEEIPGDRVALVQAVGALTPSAVGDDDRDVLERAVKLERKLVDRGAD